MAVQPNPGSASTKRFSSTCISLEALRYRDAESPWRGRAVKCGKRNLLGVRPVLHVGEILRPQPHVQVAIARAPAERTVERVHPLLHIVLRRAWRDLPLAIVGRRKVMAIVRPRQIEVKTAHRRWNLVLAHQACREWRCL